ncbi:hypothetical protein PIB30_012392, partial [Stylosanthes scabra]|nr:hypothetical protein [Stylosanthes scabra]
DLDLSVEDVIIQNQWNLNHLGTHIPRHMLSSVIQSIQIPSFNNITDGWCLWPAGSKTYLARDILLIANWIVDSNSSTNERRV